MNDVVTSIDGEMGERRVTINKTVDGVWIQLGGDRPRLVKPDGSVTSDEPDFQPAVEKAAELGFFGVNEIVEHRSDPSGLIPRDINVNA